MSRQYEGGMNWLKCLPKTLTVFHLDESQKQQENIHKKFHKPLIRTRPSKT